MSPRYLEDRKKAPPRHFRTCLLPIPVIPHLTSPLSSPLQQLGVPHPPPQTVVLRAPVHLLHIRPSSPPRLQNSFFSPVIPSTKGVYLRAIPVAPLPPCLFSTATRPNLPNRNLFALGQRPFRSFSEVSKRTARGSLSACANSKIHAPNPLNTLGQEASRGVAESAIPPAYLRPGPPEKVLYQTTTTTS